MLNLPLSANRCRPLRVASLCLFLTLSACQSTSPPQWQWQRAEAGLPRQAITLAVAADPDDPNRLWVGSYTPGGLARSDDGGQTWTSGIAGRAGNPVFDLLATPPTSSTVGGEQPREGALWAATRAGLLRSADGGASWQPAGGGLPAMPVLSLAADATGRVYAGLDTAGIYAETGDGAWESLAPPLSSKDDREEPGGEMASAGVLSLAVSPDGRQLYAGTAGRGVFASPDGGRTWVNAYPGAYAPNLALDPARPQVALASLRDQLARTQDGGKTWYTLPVAWAHDLVVSLLWRADGALGTGTGQGRLYYSPDGGDSWVEGGAGLPRGAGVLDLIATRQQLLAATWTGLYGSDNGGETWKYLTPALGQPNATTLLSTEAALWLGTRTGLYRWQPDSRQWVPMP
ncbi:MAG: hypothetical protein HYR94_14325, partial [Chloroflexi bacterium]|nr:hypothetical protein [Chloroflexota bacterium]